MCGIAGYYRLPVAPDERRGLLARMIGAIAHRGPGRQRRLRRRRRRPGARAPQHHRPRRRPPADVQRGRHRLDHLQRRDLQLRRAARRADRARPPFSTNSDTEVIVHLYEERGPDCVDALNGDFAFALWDARRQRLVLARDRMGVRPLYYAVRDGGARLRLRGQGAARRCRASSAALDPIALDQMFTFWFPLAPRTPFKDIAELPPAHVLVAERATASRRGRYWRFEFPDAAERSPGIAGATRRASPTSCARCCSTRCASGCAPTCRSAPTSAAASIPRSSPPPSAASCPTSCAPSRSPSRTPSSTRASSSSEMVDALGTEHSTDAVPRRPTSAGVLPDVIRHTERPILRTAPAPCSCCRGLVRDSGFKVVLTGEGADEVFAGYDIFKEAKVRRFCARSRTRKRRPLLLQRLYPYLPACRASRSATSRRSSAAELERARRSALLAPAALPHQRRRQGVLLRATCASAIGGYDALADLRERLPADFTRWHPLSQAQYLESALPAAGLHPLLAGRPRGDGATRSRAASRSSTIAWSSSPRASRRG